MSVYHRVLIVMCAVAFQAGPANAQGFLQSLFGGGSGAHVRSHPMPNGAPPHYRGRYAPHAGHQPWWQYGRHGQQSYRPRRRTYTAMCVRLCDGYYYPIASRASRNKLYELARKCEDGCSGAAKLFYTPTTAPNIEHMTDLSGRAYENLDNAFVYRKKRVKGCGCKPPPWSYQARAEHAKFAAYAARKKQAEIARARAQRLAMQKTEAENADAATSSQSADDLESDTEADSTVSPAAKSRKLKRRSWRTRRARRQFRQRRRVVRMRRHPQARAVMRRPGTYARQRVRMHRRY